MEAAASLNSILRLQVLASCSQPPPPCVIVWCYERGSAGVTPGRAVPAACVVSPHVPILCWWLQSASPRGLSRGTAAPGPLPLKVVGRGAAPCLESILAAHFCLPPLLGQPPQESIGSLVPPCPPRCAGLPEAAAVPCRERLLPRWLVGGRVKPHFFLFPSHPSSGPPAFSSPALLNYL